MCYEILESQEDILLFLNLKVIKYVAKSPLTKSVATTHENVAKYLADVMRGEVVRA